MTFLGYLYFAIGFLLSRHYLLASCGLQLCNTTILVAYDGRFLSAGVYAIAKSAPWSWSIDSLSVRYWVQ